MKKQQPKPSQLKKEVKSEAAPKSVTTEKGYIRFLHFAAIILLGIIIYSNSFDCSFHLDDFGSIVENKMIRELHDIKSWWNYSQTRLVAYYSFAVNYHYDQLNVWGYHLVNLIIHLINACLLWWLTILIFTSPNLKDHPITQHKYILALVTALLFVSHPLATASVTYIVQRLASMVALFYLLSIALYLKARLTDKGIILKALFFVGAFLSAMLAMMTKQNSFTLPLAILLVEFFFTHTKKHNINFKDYRTILILTGLIAFIILISLRFTFSIFKPISPNEYHTYSLTPVKYLCTEFSVILKYIQLLLIPINQMVDYDFPISNGFFESKTLMSFLVLLIFIIIAIVLYKKHRIVTFGISWFLLTLSIESSLIPIEDVIYEHRTYLPAYGFFLLLSYVIIFLLYEKYKFLSLAIFVLIVGSNSILAYQRNKVWKDELTLWNDNISKAPNLARPLYNRGVAYASLQKWSNAIADYSQALSINRNYVFAYLSRGVAYEKLNELDKAIDDYTKAIIINPKYTKAYYNRAILFGNLKLWDKAIADYTKAIENEPKHVRAYSNRGTVYATLQLWDKAILDYTKAITINPNYANAYFNRGNAYENLKEWQKAIDDYSKAIEIDPNNKLAITRRDIVYKNLKNLKIQ